MPTSRGAHIRADSKSERIVALRLQGKTWPEVAAAVGSSLGCCRVLYWKRYHWTRQFSASDPTAQKPALDPRGRRKGTGGKGR